MVDLSDGFDVPIEHGFSNVVFVIPAIIVIGVAATINQDLIVVAEGVLISIEFLIEAKNLSRMWIILASLLAVALVNADDAASVVLEANSDATVPPPDAEPGFEGKLPTAEQLLEMLDSMSGMSDEEKLSLREDLLKNIRVGGLLQAGDQSMPGSNLTMQTMVLLSLLSVVALIFGNKLRHLGLETPFPLITFNKLTLSTDFCFMSYVA
ncbi:hypothetical protein WN51_13016 [Melipona quadrifasciata]|uniref:Uncharacterized protein n=1 Tax=Melipona quadrifasciata TaxID=166423 RepID=A0A0N1IU55_9HYME|nr:hypothetical protein WN51_13016 [Melipona quadrifasciata]